MKKTAPWLVVVALFCFHSGFGQMPEYDSLIQLLDHARDTTRVRILVRLGQLSRTQSIETSEEFFHQANREALRIKDWKGAARAINGLGVTYGMQGDYARALDEFELAKDISLENGQLESAADAFSSIGVVYRRIGNYPLSLEYYQKSFQIYDSIGSVNGVLALYNNLGVVYDLMKEPDRALEMFHKALYIHDSLKITRGTQYLFNNIALIHLGKKEYEQALSMLDRAVDYAKTHQQRQGIISPLVNIGNVLLEMKRYEEAERVLEEARELSLEFNDRENFGGVELNLANLWLARGNKPKAMTYARSHLEVSEALGGIRLKATAYGFMAKMLEATGDISGALQYQKMYVQYQDSLFNEEKVRQYKSQQVLFDFQEKNKQLVQQKAEIQLLEERVKWEERQRIWLVVALSLVALAGLLLWQKFQARQRVNRVLRAKNDLIIAQKSQIEQINKELEKRMLRAQMNPHFIFNAINSIQHFITENDKVSALKFLNKFSTLLRQVLESSTDVNVLLSEEIKLLEHYIQLESLRFDGQFAYNIYIDDTLDPQQYEIPILLVQPFVENAILHGLMTKQGDRKLVLSFHDRDEEILCTVEDNGVGREAAAAEKKRRGRLEVSRGLSVTEQRLALLEKNLDYKASVQFEDLKDEEGTPAGTRVTIRIPKMLNL
jgi:tetratricopeptide (TPR) repeat protein/two-component sensor histidine kinase